MRTVGQNRAYDHVDDVYEATAKFRRILEPGAVSVVSKQKKMNIRPRVARR